MRLTYLLTSVAPVAFLLGLVVNAQILRVQRGQDAVAALKNKQDLINRRIRQRHALSVVCNWIDYGNIAEGHLLLYLPTHSQGCGTIIICCGSGSDFGTVLVPVPDPENI
jgi:hypothetical protein